MLQAGGIHSETVQSRYQSRVEQAIQFTLNLSDTQAVQMPDQTQTHL
jgi:hypothetical protein